MRAHTHARTNTITKHINQLKENRKEKNYARLLLYNNQFSDDIKDKSFGSCSVKNRKRKIILFLHG